MNPNEAKEIFLHVLPEVSGALNSAINFVLTNWHKLTYEPRASDVAISFIDDIRRQGGQAREEIYCYIGGAWLIS